MYLLNYSSNIIIESFELVKDIDINDLPIVAAALLTKSVLFTGDKKLYDSLKMKNFNSVIIHLNFVNFYDYEFIRSHISGKCFW